MSKPTWSNTSRVFYHVGFFLALTATSDEKGVSTMLVLSRKTQESIIVGGSDGFERLLKVTVLKISGGNVRLGFEIDKGVPVHRWEVWEQMHKAASAAAGVAAEQPRGMEGLP